MNANEILTYIASKIAPDSFEDDKEIPDGRSLYYTSDMGVITRVPNHRAHHRTFQERANRFGLPSRINSVVFEDEPTVGNSVLKRPRKKPFTIHEYVYPLWKGGYQLEKWEVDKIIKALIATGIRTFVDPTGKSEYLPRESQNPPTEDKSQQEVKQEKEVNRKDLTDDTKKSTKKGTGEGHITRLSELQLRKIISESVRRIFDELS